MVSHVKEDVHIISILVSLLASELGTSYHHSQLLLLRPIQIQLIEKGKETRKLLFTGLVLLKLIASESADARFDSTSADGNYEKSNESDDSIDGTGNILSAVDLRHSGNRHKDHSEEVHKGDVDNSVDFAPVRIGNNSTDKWEKIA